jgi:hypothetical protein
VALLWLSCPHCRVLFHIDDANAGKKVACRACWNSIRIPGTAPKSTVWYYTRDRKPQGPVTLEQLNELAQTGVLIPTELVWQEGMPQWVEARSISGLFPTPPPLPAVEMPAKIDESPRPAAEEPVIEIVAEAPVEPPIPIAEEQAVTLTAVPSEPASPDEEKPASEFLPRAWATKPTGPIEAEEPIQVEPEFAIDLGGRATSPVRNAAPQPTVDLVFPTETSMEPAPPEHEIELAPIEPKLELGEREESGPAVPYEIGGNWSRSRAPDIEPIQEDRGAAETYPVAGIAQPGVVEAQPVAALPVAADAVAAAPMAIPVPSEEEPRSEETEAERKSRLRSEYVQARKEWTSVRKGLNIVYISAGAWFALVGGSIIVNAAISIIAGGAVDSREQSDSGSMVSVVILAILTLAVDSLAIFGMIQCLRIPETTGAKMLVIVGLVLTGLEMFCVLVAPLVGVMVYFGLAAGFCRWFLFAFFVQNINHYFQAHLQMQTVERLLLLMGVTTGVTVLLWIGMAYLVHVFAKGEQDTASEITKILLSLCTSIPLLALTGLCTIRYLRALRDNVALIDERLYRGELVQSPT